MNSDFKTIVDQLPSLLEKLVRAPLIPWGTLDNLPNRGIYVFYEAGKPLYVGRTNRMKNRIKQHGWSSSKHTSAPFAFNLAKKVAEERGFDLSESRAELERNSNFAELFSKAKERVTKMSVRFVEVDDPIIQTLFEVYAALALQTTEYNDFDTH
jgi:predicted GIY-YIG superfamily endonuclease